MKIYLSESFLDACDKLPKNVKSKVVDTQSKLNKNTASKGLNLESIQGDSSGRKKSIRVNDDYRIILECLDNNTAILGFVGKHDDAYRWAERHSSFVDANGVVSIIENAPETKTKKDGKYISRLSVFSNADFDAIEVPKDCRDDLRYRVFYPSALVPYKAVLSDLTYDVLEQVLTGADRETVLDYYNYCTEAAQQVANSVKQIIPEPLFITITEVELGQLGVPSEYIDRVKSIKIKGDIEELKNKIPEIALQNLYAALGGEDVKKLIADMARWNTKADPDHLAIALNNAGTKQSIVAVENDEEARKLIEMPLEKWRVFLHQSQRYLAEADFNGPARVLGDAGTGKTVIVVHRAKALAKKCETGEKVLVTTFSNTLAADISNRLKEICSKEELSHIEVSTLDKKAKELLNGVHIKYDQPDPGFNTSPLDSAWNKACQKVGFTNYDADFYKNEWSGVFLAQKINTKEEYLKADRQGMGKPLDRSTRDNVFEVVEEYKKIMEQYKWADIDWAESKIAENQDSASGMYKYVLVDECQDFKPAALRLIRALAGKERKNDLFIAGDSRQRIYKGKSSLSKCGIRVNNRSIQLKVNYRTTQEIYEMSRLIQKDFEYDDLDSGKNDEGRGIIIRHGDKPSINSFKTQALEMEAVIKDIEKKEKSGVSLSDICIVAKKNDTVKCYERELESKGILCINLKNVTGTATNIGGVRLATMHRVKGMEFDHIYAVAVTDKHMPFHFLVNKPGVSEEEREDLMRLDANLLSVAITRARQFAWISYYGNPSRLLKNLL